MAPNGLIPEALRSLARDMDAWSLPTPSPSGAEPHYCPSVSWPFDYVALIATNSLEGTMAPGRLLNRCQILSHRATRDPIPS